MIHRPKGEAGDRVNGFNLQESMGLADNDSLYQDIMVTLLISRLIYETLMADKTSTFSVKSTPRSMPRGSKSQLPFPNKTRKN